MAVRDDFARPYGTVLTHARPYFPETIADIDARIDAGERITVGQALTLLGLDGAGIDTAIPHAWALECDKRTGIWPGGHVVWSYRPEHGATLVGTPIPLTGQGTICIGAMCATKEN